MMGEKERASLVAKSEHSSSPGRQRRSWLISGSLVTLVILVISACRQEPEPSVPHVTVVAEGLMNPLGMAALPDGSLFIAEGGTGQDDFSAGLSLMTPGGEIGRYISGFHSGRDSGDLSGAPLVAISPDGDTLYVGNFGAGHLWTLPLDPGQPIALPDEPFKPEQLGVAMAPLNDVKLTNPFDVTFDPLGVPVVSDASANGVAKENPDGTTRFIHRFDPLPDTSNEKVTIDPVPTGIVRVGTEYYVTLLGGCPFPPGSGLLVGIDESRNQRTVVAGLNMPVDVAQGADGSLWVLEFATFTKNASCFSGTGYQQNSGRLSRIREDGTLELVVADLNYPGAVLPMPDGSLYVSEVFDGRIVHVTFGPPGEMTEAEGPVPELDIAPPTYRDIEEPDTALAAVVQRQGLQANPSVALREGDTPLARLGQSLFFDPVLSGDRNIACATCHHPALAMADARVLPIGTGGAGLGPGRDFVEEITLGPDAGGPHQLAGTPDPATGEVTVANPFMGQFVPRNSPTVLNSALLPVQFWDGRVQSYALGQLVTTREQAVNDMGLLDALAAQALFPITSMHEMAGATLGNQAAQEIRNILVARLMEIPAYRHQFRELFGTEDVTAVHVATAIAAFERRFIFTDSPWDAYLGGDQDALTGQQKRGALLFYGQLNPAVNCAQCHGGNLFSDMAYHNLLVPQLGPGKGIGENGREDWGRSLVTYDRRDQYTFRTPGLRNVALTAPYFHTGAYATLEAVIWHHANIWEGAADYDPGAHVPPALYSSVRPFEPQKQAHSAAAELAGGLPLRENDVADLAAFLGALTDPGATDLIRFVPDAVPSGLPLDPLPGVETLPATFPSPADPETAWVNTGGAANQ
jgi:cytochrome c peroxidase